MDSIHTRNTFCFIGLLLRAGNHVQKIIVALVEWAKEKWVEEPAYNDSCPAAVQETQVHIKWVAGMFL